MTRLTPQQIEGRLTAALDDPDRAARFWAHVDRNTSPDGCWDWSGPTTRGVGRFSAGGQTDPAHRVAYELTHGAPSPRGAVFVHACGNKLCCNPAHLTLRPYGSDLTGRRFGSLVVMSLSDRRGRQGERYWVCECDCGGRTEVLTYHLRHGRITACGCNARTDNPTYRTVHSRLDKARGSAAGYSCTQCGGAAREWAYDWTDPSPIVAEVVWDDRPMEVTYSVDLERYQAMCRSCHVRYDRWRRNPNSEDAR
jgi:hypothetical protein